KVSTHLQPLEQGSLPSVLRLSVWLGHRHFPRNYASPIADVPQLWNQKKWQPWSVLSQRPPLAAECINSLIPYPYPLSDGKSESANSVVAFFSPPSSAWISFSRFLKSTRRILPDTVLGNSKNSRRRIRLYGASPSRQCLRMDSAVSAFGSYPLLSAT